MHGWLHNRVMLHCFRSMEEIDNDNDLDIYWGASCGYTHSCMRSVVAGACVFSVFAECMA